MFGRKTLEVITIQAMEATTVKQEPLLRISETSYCNEFVIFMCTFLLWGIVKSFSSDSLNTTDTSPPLFFLKRAHFCLMFPTPDLSLLIYQLICLSASESIQSHSHSAKKPDHWFKFLLTPAIHGSLIVSVTLCCEPRAVSLLLAVVPIWGKPRSIQPWLHPLTN